MQCTAVVADSDNTFGESYHIATQIGVETKWWHFWWQIGGFFVADSESFGENNHIAAQS